MSQAVPLKDIASVFLKLGIVGFGGPAAHIAMMREEVVLKRNWLSEQEFLDLIGATNLIPGPNSTELAIHIGQVKGGWKGLIVAGLCFILPAVFITGVFAFLYKKYGALPSVQPFLYGIKPAIIAIILGAVFPLAKKSMKTIPLIIIAIAVLAGALFGLSEILLLFGAGILMIVFTYWKSYFHNRLSTLFPAILLVGGNITKISASNVGLFWIFLKIGSILYGSGYVLFAFLDSELVSRGLLTRQQLIDAVAVGQFTPGPVFSSVTFIGYQIGGISGATISTLGIFLPSFVFVALLSLIVKKLRSSPMFSVFLDAVNAASVSIIIAVCIEMSTDAITDWRTALIAVISMAIVFRFRKLNSAFIVIAGALAGYLLSLVN